MSAAYQLPVLSNVMPSVLRCNICCDWVYIQ